MGKEQDLLEAARTGNIALIEKILSQRAKLKGPLGPLASLRRTANPSCQDSNGDTPLHHAALNGHREVVQLLLRYEASANLQDNKGCYPLHMAAWNGHTAICRILLTQGPSIAKVNQQNHDGETALHCAAQYGHTDTVGVLLEMASNRVTKNGITYRQVRVTEFVDGKRRKVWKNFPVYPQSEVEENSGFHQPPLVNTASEDPPVDHPTNTNKKRDRSYFKRKRTRAAQWEDIFPDLKQAYYESQTPLTNICSMCESPHEDKNIMLCQDCGPTAYFCEESFLKFHEFAPLHVPLVWMGNLFFPYIWKKKMSLPCSNCTTRRPSSIVVIDQLGRHHNVEINYCFCMNKSAFLLKLGLWPGTPKNPTTAIHLRFMNLCRAMLIEGAVAMYRFVGVMKMFATQLPNQGEEVNLYSSLAVDNAVYHRRLVSEVKTRQGITSNLPDSSFCPVCHQTCNILPKIISMDGNFRLIRKKSSGTSCLPPHHKGRFFLDQEEVQPYLRQSVPAHDLECSNFKAGSPSRTAFTTEKLDVSGVFGSICIHDFPHMFVDMTSGEKLGYAVCFISKLREKTKDVKILYDVACRILPQLKVILEGTALAGMERIQGHGENDAAVDLCENDLAVPKFHGYAHNMKCQTEFNPMNLQQFRLADGENTERMWSTLGEFAYISREMTPSNRQDLLVDVLLRLGEKAVQSFGQRMVKRLKHAIELKGKSESDLTNVLAPLEDQGIDVSVEAIQTWDRLWKARYTEKAANTEITWQMEYAVLLSKWYSLMPKRVEMPVEVEEVETQVKLNSLEDKLVKIERKRKINQRWTASCDRFKNNFKRATDARAKEVVGKLHKEAVDRKQLILMKHASRGHKAAERVSTQVKQTNTKIKGLLRHYNAITGVEPLTFQDVRDPEAAVYVNLDSVNRVPFPVIREAVRCHNTIKRAEEEVSAIGIELPALFEWYHLLHVDLQGSILQFSPPLNTYHEGVIAALMREIMYNEKHQEVLSEYINANLGLQLVPERHYSDSYPAEFLCDVKKRKAEEEKENRQEEEEEEEEGEEERKEGGENKDSPSDDEILTDEESQYEALCQ